MRLSLLTRLMLILSMMPGALPVAAATIEKTQHPLCNIRYEGAVEIGDADKLREILDGKSDDAICLNSPGGNYAEGIKIINLLLQHPRSVATAVDRGHECNSACALVFLAGHYKTGTEKVPNRKMHIRATVGFHGPYIKINSDAYNPERAAQARKAGLKAVADLMAANEERLFPYSLLGMALRKGPDEYVYVDSIDKAGYWYVSLVGIKKPTSFSDDSLGTACSNYEQWDNAGLWDENNDPTNRLHPRSTAKLSINGGKLRRVFSDYGAEGHDRCVVDLYDPPGQLGPYLRIEFAMPNARLPSADLLEKQLAKGGAPPLLFSKPLWYTINPKLKLADIPEQ